MTSAIETSGLSKTYGAVTAVVGLDLRVEPGQIFAFLGPNGAGKSTTIRMLLALQRPTAGKAAVLGLDSQADSVAIHRRVGYLPGDLALFPRLSGRRHIDWFARARGDAGTAFADELVRRFDVELDRPVRQLSTGNRQKIGIVLAFMSRPELLVLDEPTTGLDPLMQNEFGRLLRETAADGRTVFLSSHELDEVQRVADRVAIIKDGRLLVTDTVDGLRRATPRSMEVVFKQPVPAGVFDGLEGVRVVAGEGRRVVLELTADIGPVLKVIAEQDPVDIVSRHADLDELFLRFYQDTPQEATGAH
jgi:beta-exotoxin I transport system ATP-binding protein